MEWKRMIGRGLRLAATVFGLLLSSAAALAEEASVLWSALADGGHVALMRHAEAPGFGDPDNFALEDCDTQRNLSAAGRDQARAIGDRFRDHGIAVARVHSSQWCRCLETAGLLALGDVIPTPALNSFFRDRERGPQQTASVRRLIDEATGRQPLVLVTHQVNITALTGIVPASGEIVVVKPHGEELAVSGRIRP